MSDAMKLLVLRGKSGSESTAGKFFVDGLRECYTLEDQLQTGKKVPGETRIPEGVYVVSLQTFGEKHAHYAELFPDVHIGMLHILDVPGFDGILIHIGNNDDDSRGCLLVGTDLVKTKDGNHELRNSRMAYLQLYPKVARALKEGRAVHIEIRDAKGDEWD